MPPEPLQTSIGSEELAALRARKASAIDEFVAGRISASTLSQIEAGLEPLIRAAEQTEGNPPTGEPSRPSTNLPTPRTPNPAATDQRTTSTTPTSQPKTAPFSTEAYRTANQPTPRSAGQPRGPTRNNTGLAVQGRKITPPMILAAIVAIGLIAIGIVALVAEGKPGEGTGPYEQDCVDYKMNVNGYTEGFAADVCRGLYAQYGGNGGWMNGP